MSNSNEINVSLQTISDFQLKGVSFYIDAYQRGYRWTISEVNALLEDIREFSQTPYKGNGIDNDKFYCLQPIIVTARNDNNQWKVIDGQQRLTTLYLIYVYYINNISGRIKQQLPYHISYNNKQKLEDCLNTITTGQFVEPEDFEKLECFLDDIDCYFVVKAYEEICRYFENIIKNPKIQNQINDMKSVFDNYMKIIWYELVNCNEDEEVRLFTKVNMGKIPLKNAELIKALILKNENEEVKSYQENIAIQWDSIESKLSDESFWAFLVNNNKYVPRIDFVFDVMAHEINETVLKNCSKNGEMYYVEKKYNSDYFSFYIFNNYMKYLDDYSCDFRTKIGKIWDGICEYFRMFSDWYSERTWYHLIGYLTYNSGKGNIEQIYELSKIYKQKSETGKGHKTNFESELKRMVLGTIMRKNPNKEDLENFIGNLSYESDKEKIKSILLIYNFALLEIEGETDAKFAFNKFKGNSWDIEHINATADGRPADEYDTDSNESLLWLKTSLNLPNLDKIKDDNGNIIKPIIEEVISNKEYLTKNNNSNERFINVYETIIKYFNDLDMPNGIGNLTLLDSVTNRSYKNKVFPLKRREIIERCCSEVYVPLGTKKVFLKAYLEAKNLLKWSKEDSESYISDIVDKIANYLGVPEVKENE